MPDLLERLRNVFDNHLGVSQSSADAPSDHLWNAEPTEGTDDLPNQLSPEPEWFDQNDPEFAIGLSSDEFRHGVDGILEAVDQVAVEQAEEARITAGDSNPSELPEHTPASDYFDDERTEQRHAMGISI